MNKLSNINKIMADNNLKQTNQSGGNINSPQTGGYFAFKKLIRYCFITIFNLMGRWPTESEKKAIFSRIYTPISLPLKYIKKMKGDQRNFLSQYPETLDVLFLLETLSY